MIIPKTSIVFKLPHVKGEWYYYLLPKRLTLKSNPAVYRWLCFVYSWDERVG